MFEVNSQILLPYMNYVLVLNALYHTGDNSDWSLELLHDFTLRRWPQRKKDGPLARSPIVVDSVVWETFHTRIGTLKITAIFEDQDHIETIQYMIDAQVSF